MVVVAQTICCFTIIELLWTVQKLFFFFFFHLLVVTPMVKVLYFRDVASLDNSKLKTWKIWWSREWTPRACHQHHRNYSQAPAKMMGRNRLPSHPKQVEWALFMDICSPWIHSFFFFGAAESRAAMCGSLELFCVLSLLWKNHHPCCCLAIRLHSPSPDWTLPLHWPLGSPTWTLLLLGSQTAQPFPNCYCCWTDWGTPPPSSLPLLLPVRLSD